MNFNRKRLFIGGEGNEENAPSTDQPASEPSTPSDEPTPQAA